MKPLNESSAGRLLQRLAAVVIRHWRWFFYPQLVLVLVCFGYTFTSLRFSTDRDDLVSREEVFRRQFLQFRKEFQIHDNFFVLVESERREKNREFIERLAARLRLDGQFADVYYRAGLKLMGPKALLFLPEETLAGLRQSLHSNQTLLQSFSQAANLDTLFALVNLQFRSLDARSSGFQAGGSLHRSLETLQRVLDGASDSIESRYIPLAPNIPILFGDREGENQHELYLSFDRGRIYVLTTRAKDSSQEGAAVRQLRKWIDQTRLEVAGVNVEITGEPVLTQDEMEQGRHDTEIAALIALVLTGSIFIASCRNILRPLMATICLLSGIGYALGFATLTVGRLNILSITLVPILIGLAIDYGVHLIFRYEEEVRRGQCRRLAIGRALGFTGIGVIINGLTIAGAFYCMSLTAFKGVREMGWIAGSGVLLCLVPILTLLPMLLAGGKPDQLERAAEQDERCRRDPLSLSLQRSSYHQRVRRATRGPLARVGRTCLHRPWLVLAGGTVLTLFLGLQAFNLKFDYNLLHLQSRGLPAVRIQKQLVRSGSESLLYCAVTADSLTKALELEQRMSQLPSVARVISLVKYLTEDQERKLALIREIKQEVGALALPQPDSQPPDLAALNQTLFSLSGYLGRSINTLRLEPGNQAIADLLSSVRDSVNRLRRLTSTDLPSNASRLAAYQNKLFGGLHEAISLIGHQDARERLLPEDVPPFLRKFFIGTSGKFLLQVYPKADVWERAEQERFIAELRTVDPNVTGSPVQFYEYLSRLRQNVQKAAGYAAAIIAVLVFLHFRRVSSVLLALLPVALGLCWMLGLMAWLGIPFNPVNIVGLVLVIGIGVANGIHILNRFAEQRHPNILARSTGKAVLVSALNTIAGFGSLMVAKHQGIASLGQVMAIGTGTCCVASLAFLPVVLTLLWRVGWCPTERRQKAVSSNCTQGPSPA